MSNVSVLVDMNGTTDYLEAYGVSGTNGTIFVGSNNYTFFQGALIAPVSQIAGGWSNDGTQSYVSDNLDFVGIGTTTPWGRLSINPLATDNAAPSFVIGSSTATNFIVTNAGNIGIGNSAPNSILDIRDNSGNAIITLGRTGTSLANNDSLGRLRWFNTDTTNDGPNEVVAINAFVGGSTGDGGYLTFSTHDGLETGGEGSLPVERMRIDKTGNVGIGEIAPTDKLEVTNGNIRIKNDANPARLTLWGDTANVGDTGQNDARLAFRMDDVDTVGWNIDAFNYASSVSTMQFTHVDGAVNVLTLGNGTAAGVGNVGIGTTSPYARLSVVGQAVAQYFTATSTIASTFPYASTTALTASGSAYFATGGGNVGIGTTSPSYLLTLSASAPTLALNQQAGNNSSAISFYEASVLKGYIQYVSPTHPVGAPRAGNLEIATPATAPEDIDIRPGDASALYIKNGGNVGIGTTTPSNLLGLDSASTNVTALDIANGSAGSATWTLQVPGSAVTGRVGNLEIFKKGTANGLVLQPGGNVGIGDLTPDFKLDVWGTICQDTDSNDICDGTVTSDSRLKTDVANILSPLEKLAQLRGVTFEWDETNDHTLHLGRGTTQVGVIAQEVEAVFPSLVYQDMEGYKMVDYQKLVGPLIEGVNELNRRTAFIASAYGTSSPQMYIDVSGNIGIGTTTPAYKLHVNGEIAAEGFINTSSREFKTDISGITTTDEESILATIASTSIAHYRYKNEDASNPLRIGLIAEEAPSEVLSSSGKGVDVYQLATFTLAGVKAQQRSIQSLDMRVASLEEALAATTTAENGENPLIAAVNSWLSGIGIAFSETAARFNNLAASAFTVGSKEKPSGITLYDEETGDAYCVKVKGGQMVNIPGTCEQVAAQSGHAAPTLKVQGNDPATIEIGVQYNDLGVIAKDWRGNDLSIRYFVNGTPMESIIIDTASSTTYRIEYSATDTDGLSATSTRTVIVGEGSPVSVAPVEVATTTEPVATSAEETASTTSSTEI